VSEPLPGSSSGRAEGSTDNLPGVSLRAGRADGGVQLSRGLGCGRMGSGDPAEVWGLHVHMRSRAQAKERTSYPQRCGQVLDVEDVTSFGRALNEEGEDGQLSCHCASTRRDRSEASHPGGAGGGWGRCTWSQPYTFAAGPAVHGTAAG
jgi:hypothetical protein